RWEPVDETRARFVVDAGGEEVAVTIEVEPDGRLRRVSIRRWNSDPRNGPVGHLPFVMEDVVGERTFDGYTIPASFRAGWRLGEKGAFPFFFAQVWDAESRWGSERVSPAALRRAAAAGRAASAARVRIGHLVRAVLEPVDPDEDRAVRTDRRQRLPDGVRRGRRSDGGGARPAGGGAGCGAPAIGPDEVESA